MPMIRLKASVFDGERTHEAGAEADLNHDFAKQVVRLGHGELLDEDGDAMSFEEAAKTLRFNDDDFTRAKDGLSAAADE